MRLSIRNQLPATVLDVTGGQAMGTVTARLSGGQEVTAAITLEAVHDLGLAGGTAVRMLVKSTEVSLATGAADGLSIRNRIPGTVRTVEPGAVMTTVKVEIAGGDTLTAVITRESADELRLAAGDRVTALIKSTEMAVALA